LLPFSHGRTQSRLRTLSNPGVILTGAVLQAKGKISHHNEPQHQSLSVESTSPIMLHDARWHISPGDGFAQKNDLAAEGTDAFRE